MQYNFVTKLNNITFPILNKGKKFGDYFRISTSDSIFKKHFENDYFIQNVGLLEYTQFLGSPFIYSTGNHNALLKQLNYSKAKNISEKDSLEMDTLYPLNAFIRYIWTFNNCLWLVKDHSMNIETAFIMLSKNNVPYQISSNSGSVSISTATGKILTTSFSQEELNLASSYFEKLVKKDVEFSIGDRLISAEYAFKNSDRLTRSTYFLSQARGQAHLPTKISSYCTTLETLFTTTNSELVHQVSERFARMLGDSLETRKFYYDLCKKAYSIRSKVVHGQSLNKEFRNIESISKELDNGLRKLLNKLLFEEQYKEIYSSSNEKLDAWFKELILS
ncbi:HEPN domain-containing protein [Bacillus cereus]|uniref:HEPN domain-containing protein n=1 Tax=Bacillus cereus TaxID=1396 RepID=UPI000BFC748A|nr:HEPN domain-containing protein [Bacillus cereus]MCU4833938.1 HEPN domain-containing protein [Bacillus cereus]PGZ46162.1 hypothetical protein COE57_27810 [Bacillus cereus]